jgi:chemotaxis protein MotB
MARMHHLVGFVLLSIVLTGCVSQEKYNALKLDRDRLAEQLGQAQNEASSARSEADAYKNQLSALMGQGGNKEGLILNLTNQNAELQRQLDEMNRKYTDAINRVGPGSALPEVVTTALADFARQNPDLVDFDSARGIVKFKSDVTFGSGSADVTPRAREAISRFAQILNSSAATGYELMVAGHTDNTRVINPATIAAGHKDNWYLSAHRAIGVAQQLMNDRVGAQRIAVTGYAEQRPVASNASDSGRAQNRRVEVLILPTTVRSNAVVSAPGPVQGSTAQPVRPKLNKDSAGTDQRSLIPNK